MTTFSSFSGRMLLACLVSTAAILASFPTTVFAMPAVEVTGSQTEHQDQGPDVMEFQIAKATLCSLEGGMAIAGALNGLHSRLSARFGDVGFDPPSLEEIADGMDHLCDWNDDFSTDIFTIIYTECRMTMDSGGQMLDIVLPPGGGDGWMDAVDFMNWEGMRVILKRDLAMAGKVTGKGWSNNIDMSAIGAGEEVAGYETTKYRFDYSGGLGGSGQKIPGAELVTTNNSGTAWIASDVRGLDIVQSFYQSLSQQVDASQGAGSFMSGLISNLVGMLEQGMPLKMDQTVSSSIAGRVMAHGRSEMEVYTVDRIRVPDDWCSINFIPADLELKDVQSEIQKAMTGNNGSDSSNAEAAAAMADAQKQHQEAMKNLTPEQKAMMEQMGMGNLDQLMGGMGASAPSAAAPAATSSKAAKSAPSSRSASGSESSANADPYYSDNTLQMVQRQLQALGYDTGNTDGKASMQSTIAISQFQAENGMKVTGEASPELAGILSARLSRN